MSADSRVLVPAAELAAVIKGCFEGLGIGESDAGAVADALMYANLREIDSHGFERVPVYMRRVRAGLSHGSERTTVVADTGPLCCIDAGHGLGPAVGVKTSDRAIELARQYGVGLVAVRNATNFGAAGFYALRVAKAGLIGIVTTNTPKLMAPYGAADAFLGSNPLAIAVPLDGRDEFVLDMSSTVTARGKIRRAEILGEPLAPDLALDAGGQPTTDAKEALAGTLLPVGGPKGSGLAFAINLLVGILAGADFDDEVASIYSDVDRAQNLGQLFLALDASKIGDDRNRTAERSAALLERFHGLHTAAGFQTLQYPGEGAASRARRRLEAGVPVDTADIEAVSRACLDCDIPQLAERVRALRDAGQSGLEGSQEVDRPLF